MKTYEIITSDNKSRFVSAKNKKQILSFWVSKKPKKIIIRKDIHFSTNAIIL